MALKARNRKIGIAVAGGALVAGVFAASAASLGSLTASDLGTTANVVAACQTSGLGVNWGTSTYAGAGTATSTSGSTYTVSAVDLTGVLAACNGQNVKVQLADAAGAAVPNGSGTGTATTGTTSITLAGAVDTKSVEQITVTIFE